MSYNFENNVPFFGPTMPEDVRDFFDRHGKVGFADKKTPLFPVHEKNILYVRSGIIGGFIINDNLSKPNCLRLVMPNRIYGGQFFLDNKYIANHLFVVSEAEYVYIGVEQLRSLLDKDLQMYKKCVHLFSAYATRDEERYYILLTTKADYRMRLLVRSLALMLPQDDSEWNVMPHGITREQCSQIIYTTINTVDTILKEWKAAGLYKRADRKMFIHRRVTDNIYRDGNTFTEMFYSEDWR